LASNEKPHVTVYDYYNKKAIFQIKRSNNQVQLETLDFTTTGDVDIGGTLLHLYSKTYFAFFHKITVQILLVDQLH
jgi:hypothetical protein